MGEDLANVAQFAVQFGFAGVAAVALWGLVQKLIPQLMSTNAKLVDIVEQNSKALAESAAAMREVVAGQKEMSIRIGRIDDRLLAIEKQHEYGAKECPLIGCKEPATKLDGRQ